MNKSSFIAPHQAEGWQGGLVTTEGPEIKIFNSLAFKSGKNIYANKQTILPNLCWFHSARSLSRHLRSLEIDIISFFSRKEEWDTGTRHRNPSKPKNKYNLHVSNVPFQHNFYPHGNYQHRAIIFPDSQGSCLTEDSCCSQGWLLTIYVHLTILQIALN